MKLHLPGRRAEAEPSPAAADATDQLVRAAGKGRPTPKRSEAQGRRPGPPPPPPTTRKEAYRRMRQTQGSGRSSIRAAAARGDDSALPARDRGPVRKLVRDVVDSRRNVASIFLFVALLMIVAQVTPSATFRSYVFAGWTALFLLIVVDSFVLGRKVKAAVVARFPDTNDKMRSLIWYGISRSTMIRRWRYPKADPAVVRS